MPRTLENEEILGDEKRADEIFNQQNKNPMEETFKEIGRIRLQLETANRLRMWAHAQELCEALAHQYSQLKLEVKREEQEK